MTWQHSKKYANQPDFQRTIFRKFEYELVVRKFMLVDWEYMFLNFRVKKIFFE